MPFGVWPGMNVPAVDGLDNKTIGRISGPDVMTALLYPVSGRLALLAGLLMPLSAFAQAAQVAAAPSSQLELRTSGAGSKLATAMSALAAEPRNLDALISAGEAALQLGDAQSAIGFFGRADDVSPDNGRVKAGLGRSMLALDRIADGLRLMEQAASLGYSDAALLADRGLARDLMGNQAGAQQDYLAAMKLDPDDDRLIRRYAVSLGISGQVDQAEKTIEPLLHKNDRAAWRDRAFILAMNGRRQEALDITSKVMPKALADAIEPYMVRMAMLTPAQRAAAVHFGQFPQGLVDVRVASTAVPVKPSVAVAEIEAGKKGRKKAAAKVEAPEPKAKGTTRQKPAPAAPVPAAPAQRAVAATLTPATPAAAAAKAEKPAARPVPAPGSEGPVRIATTASSGTSGQRPVQGPPAPQSGTPSANAAPPAPRSFADAPAPNAAAPAAPGESSRSLADIIADIEIPAAERRNEVVPVNLAEIAAMQAAERKAREAEEAKARKEEAKRKADAEAKAKAEAERKRLADNPARYWVQIGAGRDTGALGFTLRRMKKDYAVLAKQDGWWADYGRTKRLVVGPFRNLDRAKTVAADMKKAGSDALVWRSDAGEEVRRIDD